MSESDRRYEDECGDHGGTNRQGEPCGNAAGMGTDFDSGKCKHHRGTSADGSSHEGNTFAAKHGVFVDANPWYNDIATETERELVEDMYEDYLEKYEAKHGEPPSGHEAELFRIAVSHGKDLHAERWAANKPDDLESGHAMVDRETHYTDDGTEYHRYKETVLAKAQKRLSTDRRQWLKSFDLLEDADSKQAESTGDLASAIAKLADDD